MLQTEERKAAIAIGAEQRWTEKGKTMNKYEILVILFYLVVAVGCIALGAWLFTVIMASDMPDWLKYLLLR
jgi:hypothetical protein